jgi:hypothetical protein
MASTNEGRDTKIRGFIKICGSLSGRDPGRCRLSLGWQGFSSPKFRQQNNRGKSFVNFEDCPMVQWIRPVEHLLKTGVAL